MSDVGVWLNKKFVEWQSEQGRPMNQKDFARWLGIKPTTYSGWINDDIPPSGENVHKIAYKLGFEIYDLTGVAQPAPITQMVIATQEAYNALPPEGQQELIAQLNQIIQNTLKEFGAKASKKVR